MNAPARTTTTGHRSRKRRAGTPTPRVPASPPARAQRARSGDVTGDAEWPAIEHGVLVLATPADVFRAVATADGLNAWLSKDTVLEPWVGGRVRLCHGTTNGDGREDFGVVRAYIPNHRLQFTWPPSQRETLVTIELTSHGPGTYVSLRESGYARTDEELQMLLHCAASWGEALALLKWHLEGA